MKLFEKMFDMNHDGELDVFERAGEFAFVASFIDAQKKNEIVDAGIDSEELEFMDFYERNNVLRDAGLDPEDFD